MPRSPNAEPWIPRTAGAAGRIVYRPRAAGPVAERWTTPAVATVLAVGERASVDAAGQGVFHMLHRDTLDELAGALRAGPVGAVVLSTHALGRTAGARWVARVAELTRAFPAVPAVALVSADVELAAVFALGRGGVRAVIDVRRPDGWLALRTVLTAAARPEVARLAGEVLAPHLADASADVRRFVSALFDAPSGVTTVSELARALGVLPTTLMSRFFRAALPAPKRYLAYARLVRAADLLANPAWTVAAVADHLEYSSAQGFSRHLHLLLGVRPAEFRRRCTARLLLERFGDELLTPYHDTLHAFWPLRR